jgi:hypothetical protein
MVQRRVGENYKVKMAKLQTKVQKRALQESLRRNISTNLAGTYFPPYVHLPAKSTPVSRQINQSFPP